jgi:hypothetical protein
MALDETARFELHETLREELGDRNGDRLMSMLPPVGWADVATKQDLERLEVRLMGKLHEEINRLTWRIITIAVAISAVLTANNLL